MPPLNLAIVGCGGMAGAHLRAYHQIKAVEPEKFNLVAVCDPVRELAQRFADQTAPVQGFAPQVYMDLEEMLDRERLDGADLCTPHSDHHISAVACLDAGVHVIVEKPFGVTVKASRRIIEAARRSGRIAATAENVRRGLSQRTAHWLINERRLIGDLRLFFAQHASWQSPTPPPQWHWRVDRWMGGGGMVMDSGAHFCDTLRYLFGDVETVYAHVSQREPRPHVKGGETVNDDREDTWVATLTFQSGLVGVWSWTMSAPGHAFTHVVYYGSHGAIVDHGDVFHGPFGGAEVRLLDGRIRSFAELQGDFLNSLSEAERNRLFPHDFREGVVLECYDFLDAIANARPPEVDGLTGLKAKALCEAIFESACCGQAVRYDDVLEGRVNAYQRTIDEHWGL